MSNIFNEVWLLNRFEELLEEGLSAEEASQQAHEDLENAAHDYADMVADEEVKNARG